MLGNCLQQNWKAEERVDGRMEPVKVRNLKIGEGIPKICVPLVGVSKDEILEAAKEIKEIPID